MAQANAPRTPVWRRGWLIAIYVLAGFVVLLGLVAVTASSPADTVSDATCLRDLDCVAKRHDWWRGAEDECVPAIEGWALYRVDWMDGSGQPVFETARLGTVFQVPTPTADGFVDYDQAAWVQDHQTLHFSGNAVRFENGFGAFARMSYTCVYDPLTGAAEAEVEPYG